jgi:hypothetical protein
MGTEPEQFSHSVILHRHVQIRRRDGDVGVPSGVAGFRKRSATVSRQTALTSLVKRRWTGGRNMWPAMIAANPTGT